MPYLDLRMDETDPSATNLGMRMDETDPTATNLDLRMDMRLTPLLLTLI